VIGLQSGEEKIGGRIGWSREKIKNHVTLRSKIGAEILFLAKTFQAGRAPSNGANAPKNERSVTSGLSGVIIPLLYDKGSLLRCRNLLTCCRETSVVGFNFWSSGGCVTF